MDGQSGGMAIPPQLLCAEEGSICFDHVLITSKRVGAWHDVCSWQKTERHLESGGAKQMDKKQKYEEVKPPCR